RIEAEIPEPAEQELDAAQDVVGIEADRGEHDADQDRQQDQPERDRKRRAAEKAAEAVMGRRQFPGIIEPGVVGHRSSPWGFSADHTRRGAHGEPVGLRQWLSEVTKFSAVSAFSSFSSDSSRSASRGGLSQRKRLMRGKRMAMPDLCRVERCRPSKATSSTRPSPGSCTTWRTGPNFSVVLRRTKRSISISSSSVKPK